LNAAFDLKDVPRFIAVEGPIGVGKTSLTKRLAQTFNYQTLLENSSENPFLERFYQNRKQAALPAQLFFLFERARQIEELRQTDMFEPIRVSDFLIEKDRMFAQINLNADELKLYENIYQHMVIDAPQPDLVIYLQAPPDVLMKRVVQRGVKAERLIDKEYLEELSEAYTEFFHYYDNSPLLIVNAADIDLVDDENDYEQLVACIVNIKNGRHYYNPATSIF
jgi:deoxyguanosine kinase